MGRCREKILLQFVEKLQTLVLPIHYRRWGDGEQTRSFLYIDDCVEATRRLMESDCKEVINIGSEEMVSINELVRITAKVPNKSIGRNHIDCPLGVRGRNSQNDKISRKTWMGL